MCWASTLCCQWPSTRRRTRRRTHPAGGTVFWVTSLKRPVFGRKRWRKTREISAGTACRLTKLNKTAFARGVAFFTAIPAWSPRGVSCPRVDTFSLRSPRGPRGDFLSPRGYPRPRGVGTVPVPVPVAPCPSLTVTHFKRTRVRRKPTTLLRHICHLQWFPKSRWCCRRRLSNRGR
jgi:hypothetical protein